MQNAWPPRASVTYRTGFRHAVMIHHTRAVPELFQMIARARDTAARLAAHDNPSYRGGREVDPFLSSNLHQA